MRTVQFGEIRTSVLGFGCGSVMGRVGRRDSLRAMHTAWDAGVTLFDTARSYGYGEAEGLLGEFLAGKRAQATVVTKFGILPALPSRWKQLAKPLVRGALAVLPQARALMRRSISSDLSPGHFDVATLRRSLDESLRHLRTDYVDVLLAHEAPATVMDQDDLMAELEAIRRAGKARRIGLACSVAAEQEVMLRAPVLLGALQCPWQVLGQVGAFKPNAQRSIFRIANHPFGGSKGAHRLKAVMHTLINEPMLPASLRETLQSDAKIAAARFVFSSLLQNGFHAVVPSMLHLENLLANVAAIEAEGFSVEECVEIRQRIAL